MASRTRHFGGWGRAETRAAVRNTKVPTPLYVCIDPDNPKRVDLRFNTVEEAQLAWRLLGQMASDHADMIRAEKDKEIADAAMHLRNKRLAHE